MNKQKEADPCHQSLFDGKICLRVRSALEKLENLFSWFFLRPVKFALGEFFRGGSFQPKCFLFVSKD